MKKIIVGAGLAGSGMITGGFGLLVANGYDVTNPEVWSIAAYLARTEPMTLLNAAMSGPDRPLFSGLSFIFGGLSVFAVGLATTSLITIISSLRRPPVKTAADKVVDEKPKATKAKRSFKLPKLGGMIGNVKARLEADKEIDLDEGGGGGKFVDIPETPSVAPPEATHSKKSFMSKVMPKVEKTDRPNRVIFKRSMKEEMTDFIAGLKDRFGGSGVEQTEEKLRFGQSGSATKQGEFGKLSQWYVDAQSGASDQDELVATAREICAEWTDADFAEFASLDPLNGAFIVRLVKSWADRMDDEDEDDAGYGGGPDDEKRRDKEAMRAAFRAIKNGADIGGEDEDEVDLDEDDLASSVSSSVDDGEDVVDLDADQDEDDFDEVFSAAARKVQAEEMHEDVDPPQASGVDDGEDEEDDFDAVMAAAAKSVNAEAETEDEVAAYESEGDAEGSGVIEQETSTNENAAPAVSGAGNLEDLADLLAEMRGFTSVCQAALSGEEEWPEDWADEAQRMNHALALSSALEEQEFAFGSDLLAVVRENVDEHEEFEWAAENETIFVDGFPDFIKAMMRSDEVDDDDHDDASNAETEEASEADSDEDVDDDVADIEASDDGLTSDVVEVDDHTEFEFDGEESAQLDENSNEAEGDVAVSDMLGSDGDIEDDETAVSSAVGGEDEGADQSDERGSALMGEDVGISPFDEIEASDSLPYEWGRRCKKAGANDGTVAKLIFAKEGKSFRTLGMAHVVMIWKKAGESDRVNIILKKLPSGRWTCKLDGSLRMENDQGQFVEISQDLLEHSEISEHKTIVHFYGDGLEEVETIRVGEKLLTVSQLMTEQEISDFMEK